MPAASRTAAGRCCRGAAAARLSGARPVRARRQATQDRRPGAARCRRRSPAVGRGRRLTASATEHAGGARRSRARPDCRTVGARQPRCSSCVAARPRQPRARGRAPVGRALPPAAGDGDRRSPRSNHGRAHGAAQSPIGLDSPADARAALARARRTVDRTDHRATARSSRPGLVAGDRCRGRRHRSPGARARTVVAGGCGTAIVLRGSRRGRRRRPSSGSAAHRRHDRRAQSVGSSIVARDAVERDDRAHRCDGTRLGARAASTVLHGRPRRRTVNTGAPDAEPRRRAATAPRRRAAAPRGRVGSSSPPRSWRRCLARAVGGVAPIRRHDRRG